MQIPIILGRINYLDNFYIMRNYMNTNYILCSYYVNDKYTNKTTIYYCWVNYLLQQNFKFLYNTFNCIGTQNSLYFQDTTIGNYLGMGQNNCLVNTSLPYIFYIENEYNQLNNYLFSSVNYNVHSGYQGTINILYINSNIYANLYSYLNQFGSNTLIIPPSDFKTIFFLPQSWYSNCEYTSINQNNTISYFLNPTNNQYGIGIINYDICNSLNNNFTYCTGDNVCGTNNCFGICSNNNNCEVDNISNPLNTNFICNNNVYNQIQISFDYYIVFIIIILILILILGIILIKKTKNKTNSNYNSEAYNKYISSYGYYREN